MVLTSIVRNYGPVNVLRKVPHMTAYFLRVFYKKQNKTQKALASLNNNRRVC